MTEITLSKKAIKKLFKNAKRAVDEYNANYTPENQARFDTYTDIFVGLGLDSAFIDYILED